MRYTKGWVERLPLTNMRYTKGWVERLPKRGPMGYYHMYDIVNFVEAHGVRVSAIYYDGFVVLRKYLDTVEDIKTATDFITYISTDTLPEEYNTRTYTFVGCNVYLD